MILTFIPAGVRRYSGAKWL